MTSSDYADAPDAFKAFLADARGRMGHAVENDDVACSAVDAVLQVFRRRLTPPEVIAFGDVLPATLRAMLVFNWKVDAVPVPWGSRSELVREVMAMRKSDGLTPLNVIDATAFALWKHCDPLALAKVLSELGAGAQEFWGMPAEVTEELLDQQS
ncbi:DUF2267 domain-containing protein [Celeribacter litoreus]|uniref:DUF2267 domain-containing protein n=1 Tax=Celeribacter litoreus TaxID=2876714 RepID=UPI001CCF52E5|nr:DUF2267 domain-containing protein [Celeribacter litoreus]MCA0042678.1 DUF2267 domain-containing protein [Celeribacter litoreus]